MADIKPLCDSPGEEMGDSTLSRIGSWAGIISSVAAVVEGVMHAAGVVTPIPIIGISTTGVLLASAVGAGLGLLIVSASVYGRLTSPKGLKGGCYAGVVTGIEPSFGEPLNHLAPYAAKHDRVDVVVKPEYWELIERGFKVYCDGDTQD